MNVSTFSRTLEINPGHSPLAGLLNRITATSQEFPVQPASLISVNYRLEMISKASVKAAKWHKYDRPGV